MVILRKRETWYELKQGFYLFSCYLPVISTSSKLSWVMNEWKFWPVSSAKETVKYLQRIPSPMYFFNFFVFPWQWDNIAVSMESLQVEHCNCKNTKNNFVILWCYHVLFKKKKKLESTMSKCTNTFEFFFSWIAIFELLENFQWKKTL